MRKALKRMERDGALSIRDIHDGPMENDRPWAIKKPSKRALMLAFFRCKVVIAGRDGRVEKHELADRHLGWEGPPDAASE